MSIAWALFALIVAGCYQPSSNVESCLDDQHLEPHWAYAGETGPEHWDKIDCACEGNAQSPVNIIEIDAVHLDQKNKVQFFYSPNTKIHELTNNGHSIQYNFEKGDYVILDKVQYNLTQIHFHEPAEHTIDGIRYPLEMHLVHRSNQGEFLVQAILAKEGRGSEPFEFLEKYLPVEVGQTRLIDTVFDLNSALPANTSYYAYMGSLTTPPCTENVHWIVFKNAITISLEQVKTLQRLMPHNNYRNEQPLNGRAIGMCTQNSD